MPGDVCVGEAVEGEEDVVGTQTPFCNTELVPQKPFVVVEDVVGTQTPDELDVPKF